MNFPNSGPGLLRSGTNLTPAAALATSTGIIWYSDSTNRSAGTWLGPHVDEIIDLALNFFPQYDRSSLVLFSTPLAGTYAALLTTDDTQPPPSAAIATTPPPQNFPNAVILALQMVPGMADHFRAIADIRRDLKRGWRKELRMVGQTPQEGIQRFWVSFRDGSERVCDGFNRMEQRPFEDRTEDL